MKLRINRFFRVLVFTVILCLLITIGNYFLYNDNTYTRVMFHEMYDSQFINAVFIGSSNVYRHFDPEVWDRRLGMYTFNLGTSSQTPDDSYYIMKELFKSQSPHYCIYGINSILFLDMDVYDNPTKSYIIFDYLKPSINKYVYGYTAFRENSILNAWLPVTRNANKDLTETVKNVVSVKSTEAYQTYGNEVYKVSEEEYRGRGFVYSYRKTVKGTVGKMGGYKFSDYEISDRYISYMKKLKKLCDKNNCELIFVIPPLPYASMKAQGSYQEIVDVYDKTAAELGVEVFHFDLSRPEYLTMEDDDFYDHAHMSGKGAEKFSEAASQLVKKYIDKEELDKNKYFYSSYEDLLNHSPWVFNAWIEKTEGSYTAYSSYGNGVIPEYCFLWSGDEGENWQILQEYSKKNQILESSIPAEGGMLMIWAKPEGYSQEEADFQQCDRITLK